MRLAALGGRGHPLADPDEPLSGVRRIDRVGLPFFA